MSEENSEDRSKIDVQAALPGARIHPLEFGQIFDKAFLVVRTKDSNGEVSWAYRTTEPFVLEELLGVLTIQVDLLRRRLIHEWEEG